MTGTPGYTSYGAVVTFWNPGSSPQSLSEFVIDWGSNGVLLSQEPVEVSAEIAPGTAYTETVSAPPRRPPASWPAGTANADFR